MLAHSKGWNKSNLNVITVRNYSIIRVSLFQFVMTSALLGKLIRAMQNWCNCSLGFRAEHTKLRIAWRTRKGKGRQLRKSYATSQKF